jgi:hypothetical protein
MKPLRPAIPVNSLLVFAQSTFYDALPSNVERRGPTAPAVASDKRAPRERVWQRWMTAIDNWFYRQGVKERERYLAQSKDVFELEDRIRRLERSPRPYY